MKEHEYVLVFARGKWVYNKQMQERTGSGGDRVQYGVAFRSKSENYREFDGRDHKKLPELRVPSSWQKFNTEVGLHPQQKPVPLFRYLTRTYSEAGATVLDFSCGSATTAIAAMEEGRKPICIEKTERFFEVSKVRIEDHLREKQEAMFA